MAKAATKTAKKAPKLSVHDEILAALQNNDEDFKGFQEGKANKKESDQDYIRRSLEAVNELPDEDFEGLSEGAQSYINSTMLLVNDKKNKKPLPAMPGMEGDDDEDEDEDEAPAKKSKAKPADDDDDDDDEDEKPTPKKKSKAKPADDDDDEEDEKPTKKSKKSKSDDDDDDDEEDEKPAKGGKGSFGGKKAAPFAPKPDGITYQTRLAIARHKDCPDVSPDDIRKALSKVGIDAPKASSITTILGDFKSTWKALAAAGKVK